MKSVSRFAVTLLALSLATLPPSATGASKQDTSSVFDTSKSFYSDKKYEGIAYLNGDITAKTVDEVKNVISVYRRSPAGKSDELMSVRLNSLGGDVGAALEIGRLLRAQRVRMLVWKGMDTCASACVLVLAAGVQRIIDGPVIVHRPYFAASSSEPNQKEIQASFQGARSAVRSYLQEMNVDPNFWDLMVSISPSDAHQLSREEMAKFGLWGDDPVEDEIKRQKEANQHGISTSEQVQREGLAMNVCEWGAAQSDEFGHCVEYFMWGGSYSSQSSSPDFAKTFEVVDATCRRYEKDPRKLYKDYAACMKGRIAGNPTE